MIFRRAATAPRASPRSFACRSRSALATTLTDESAMAAAAMTGDDRMANTGSGTTSAGTVLRVHLQRPRRAGRGWRHAPPRLSGRNRSNLSDLALDVIAFAVPMAVAAMPEQVHERAGEQQEIGQGCHGVAGVSDEEIKTQGGQS